MESVEGPFVSVNAFGQNEAQSLKSGGFVLVSGCLCMDPAAMVHVSLEDVRKQTAEVLKQMEAILMAAGTSLSQRGQHLAAQQQDVQAQPTAGPLVEATAMVVDTGAGQQRFQCSHQSCSKTFKNKDNLQKHMARHSNQVRVLICNKRKLNGEICNFQAIDAGKMSNHKKYSLAHNRKEDFPFVCPTCSSRFPRHHEYNRHIKICKGRGGPKDPAKRRHMLLQPPLMYSEGTEAERQLQLNLMSEQAHAGNEGTFSGSAADLDMTQHQVPLSQDQLHLHQGGSVQLPHEHQQPPEGHPDHEHMPQGDSQDQQQLVEDTDHVAQEEIELDQEHADLAEEHVPLPEQSHLNLQHSHVQEVEDKEGLQGERVDMPQHLHDEGMDAGEEEEPQLEVNP